MEKYDVVMVFPAMGKTMVSEKDDRFEDWILLTITIVYRISFLIYLLIS